MGFCRPYLLTQVQCSTDAVVFSRCRGQVSKVCPAVDEVWLSYGIEGFNAPSSYLDLRGRSNLHDFMDEAFNGEL